MEETKAMSEKTPSKSSAFNPVIMYTAIPAVPLNPFTIEDTIRDFLSIFL